MLFWVFSGIALLILEILFSTFYIIFFALAAFVVALITLCISIGLPLQIGLFASCSLVFVFLLRKLIKKKIIKASSDTNDNYLIGEIGVLVEDVAPNSTGKVMIRDTAWKATCSETIAKGTKVKVLNQQNLTLEVWPL